MKRRHRYIPKIYFNYFALKTQVIFFNDMRNIIFIRKIRIRKRRGEIYAENEVAKRSEKTFQGGRKWDIQTQESL
jgi:hypothetical protein